MLKYRLILGPVMIAALLGVLWLDQWAHQAGRTDAGVVLLILLVLPGIRLASRELELLMHAKGVPTDFRVLFVSGAAGAVGVYAIINGGVNAMLLPTLAIGALLYGVIARCWRKNTADTLFAAAAALFSFVYLGLMPGMLLAIRADPKLGYSAWVLGAVLLITKACDIGAYFTGTTLGKHKLIPWLSPGKTWEGLAGGVVLSGIVAGLTLTPKPMAGLSWPYAIALGVVFGLVGQLGDLLASMFKRDANVKDSGSSIPGFGGILDVIDSPLLVGVIAYWLLSYTG